MPTPDLINLEATLAEITEYWRPRVIGADRACRRAAVAGGLRAYCLTLPRIIQLIPKRSRNIANPSEKNSGRNGMKISPSAESAS